VVFATAEEIPSATWPIRRNRIWQWMIRVSRRLRRAAAGSAVLALELEKVEGVEVRRRRQGDCQDWSTCSAGLLRGV
jgi:hypothetical protein